MRARFLRARPGDTVIFVRTYLGITSNILLTQNIPRLPAGARLPTVFLFAFFGDYVVRRALLLPFSFAKEKEKESNEKSLTKRNFKYQS